MQEKTKKAKKSKEPKKLTKAKIKSMARTAKRKGLAQWSLDVRNRDNNQCIVCAKTTFLNAHHLVPKESFKDYQFELDNGVTLCSGCHKYGKFSAHKHGVWFSHWMEKNRPIQYQIALARIEADLKIEELNKTLQAANDA